MRLGRVVAALLTAVSWVFLAALYASDALSNLVGRRWGRPPFLGRPDRSLVGSVAFLLTAWPAAFLAHAPRSPAPTIVSVQGATSSTRRSMSASPP